MKKRGQAQLGRSWKAAVASPWDSFANALHQITSCWYSCSCNHKQYALCVICRLGIPAFAFITPVANKEGTVAALLATAKAAERLSSSTPAADEAAPSDLAASVLIPSLRSLRLLMQLPDCRASFLAAGGPALLLQLLQRCCAALSTAQQADDKLQQQQQYQLAAAVAALAEAAAWQDEDAKCM
jgi:hypothetical protein